MSDDCRESREERQRQPSHVLRKDRRNETFEGVEHQNEGACTFTERARCVRRADVPAALYANVGFEENARDDQAERKRSEKKCKNQRSGLFHYSSGPDRGRNSNVSGTPLQSSEARRTFSKKR